MFWKLEPQKRGAPHFHFIGELGEEINIILLRKYFSHIWFRVCGTGDPKHLKAGVQADYINDTIGKIRAYVCKYTGKEISLINFPEWSTPGRFWGVHGRENLPPKLANVINLSKLEYIQIKRHIRNWLKRLSPSSRKYSNRLSSIPSFHILAHFKHIQRIVEHVIDSKLPSPQPIENFPPFCSTKMNKKNVRIAYSEIRGHFDYWFTPVPF